MIVNVSKHHLKSAQILLINEQQCSLPFKACWQQKPPNPKLWGGGHAQPVTHSNEHTSSPKLGGASFSSLKQCKTFFESIFGWHLLWDRVQASCAPKEGFQHLLKLHCGLPPPSAASLTWEWGWGHTCTLLSFHLLQLLPAHTPTRLPCSPGDGEAQSSPTSTFMKAGHFTQKIMSY